MRWVILLASFFNICQALPMQNHQVDPQALRSLTETLGIPKEANLVEQTQKRWLRKPSEERWELKELFEEQKNYVLCWARQNHFFEPWKPSSRAYEQALILGSTTSSMQARLDYLTSLWEEGVRFEVVFWLTGERPLDATIDQLLDQCKTESDAARLLWEKSSLSKKIEAVFISVPMQMVNGILKRPVTHDTLIAYLPKSSNPTSVVVVSEQPFCLYQYAIVKAVFPKNIPFDVVGPGIKNREPKASVILDTIARYIYVENISSHMLP
jgi:hypothetical protein